MNSRADQRLIWFICLFCVAFEIPILLSDRNDMEQYDYEYYSALWQLKDVVRLHAINYWQDSLGFGSPLPIGFNLTFHPVLSLVTVLPDRIVIPSFQLLHVLIAVLYLNALLIQFNVRAIVRGVVVTLYVLGATTLYNHYVEDWPVQVFITSLLPVIVYYVEKFLAADSGLERWRQTLIIGLVLAALFVWGHPGVWVMHLAVIALYTVIRAGIPPPRPFVAMAAVAGVIACSIYSPELFRLARHLSEFDTGLVKYSGADYNLIDWFAWALWPLDPMKLFHLEQSKVFSELYTSPRNGFFSCVFFVAVFAGLRSLYHAVATRTCDARCAGAVAFFVGIMLSTVKPEWYRHAVSAPWLFRDSAILFGLLVYANTFNDRLAAFQAGPVGRRGKPLLLSAVVTLVSVVAVGQSLYAAGVKVSSHLSRSDIPFRGDVAKSDFFRRMNTLFPQQGLIVYPSVRVEETLVRRGGLRGAGVYASSDFARAGYSSLVRRYFKNYSTDVFHDDYALFYGHIPSVPMVIESKAALDFFGINIVIVSEQELQGDGFPNIDRDLTYVGDYRIPVTGERLLFYRNSTALPRALSFARGTLPAPANVVTDRVINAQWGSVMSKVLKDEPVHVTGSDGRYTFALRPHDEARTVLFKQWYRTEWRAMTAAGTLLPVEPLYKGFIGIDVPADVNTFTVEYRPVVVQWLWILSAAVAASIIGCVYVLGRRARTGAPA